MGRATDQTTDAVARLTVLGGTDLRRNGMRVSAVLTQPKRLAVLAYLAARPPGTFVRREHLLGVFWPESTGDRARTSLRQTLHFLRREVGPETLVNRGQHEIGVHQAHLWCDAAAFDAALVEGRARDAVELFGGEFLRALYVPGSVAFENWLDARRRHFGRAAGSAAWSLAESEEAAGNLVGAAHWARRAADLLPLDELRARQVMELLHRAGDTSGALGQFRVLERRLAREMEASPSAATRELFDRIRREAGADNVERSTLTPEGPSNGAPQTAPQDEPDLAPAQVLPTAAVALSDLEPEITVVRKLGEGSVSEEYLARETPLTRSVVVKILAESLQSSPEARVRFERESLAAARIDHPGVLPVYRVGRLSSGWPYSLRPYVEGRTLDEHLSARGPLPPGEARGLGAQVADVLAAAHEVGVVHRDVRPATVWVTPAADRLYIRDFGLAQILESVDEEVTRLTRTGVVIGDPEYVSPEQMRGEPVTDRSDVYSLGVLIRRLLVGAENPAEAMEDIRDGLPSLAKCADPALLATIRRCLNSSPRRRPTAREVAEALSRIPVAGTEEASKTLPRRLTRRPAILWGAALLGAAVAFVVLSGLLG